MAKKKGKEEYPEMPDMVQTAPDYGMMPGCGPGHCFPGMMPSHGMGMYCFCVPSMHHCGYGMMPDYSMIPIYDYDSVSQLSMMPDDDC